jgi:hypothetical protein
VCFQSTWQPLRAEHGRSLLAVSVVLRKPTAVWPRQAGHWARINHDSLSEADARPCAARRRRARSRCTPLPLSSPHASPARTPLVSPLLADALLHSRFTPSLCVTASQGAANNKPASTCRGAGPLPVRDGQGVAPVLAGSSIATAHACACTVSCSPQRPTPSLRQPRQTPAVRLAGGACLWPPRPRPQ